MFCVLNAIDRKSLYGKRVKYVLKPCLERVRGALNLSHSHTFLFPVAFMPFVFDEMNVYVLA